jgi:hypothetical protein
MSFTINNVNTSLPTLSSGDYKLMPRQIGVYSLFVDNGLEEAIYTPMPRQVSNGDEERYPNKIANFTKGLPHNTTTGEVDLTAYASLKLALQTRNPLDFNKIILGGVAKLTNPQAGLAFTFLGLDSHYMTCPPPPEFASAEMASEMVENYWMAICRDVHFEDYASDPLTLAACSDLNNRADFRGPKIGGLVTPATLFRGLSDGCIGGPYISQFLLLGCPFGAVSIDQKLKTYTAGIDFMTDWTNYINIQNGGDPLETQSYDATLRYLRNGRDLSSWVMMDVLFQAYFHALLIIMNSPSTSTQGNGIGCPPAPSNPYIGNPTQSGFATFGGPDFAAMFTGIASDMLKSTWYSKWFVNMRLRPEAFGGCMETNRLGTTNFPINSDILSSTALPILLSNNGTYLLPQAYSVASPMHSSYLAGHSSVAAACVTIIKAYFDETFVIPNPVQVSSDGLSLVPYIGPPLTVGGELDKLANNISLGRNIAGVHYRSDATSSLAFGEQFAISVLKQYKKTYNENFSGFSFTGLEGNTINI